MIEFHDVPERTEGVEMLPGSPAVSVVIPTYNSARTIRDCLKSIRDQDYPGPVEVIVVDNLSTDETTKIATEFGAKLIELRSSIPSARNIGARIAKGEFILNLDSDMYLSKTVIRECVDTIRGDEETVAVRVPRRVIGSRYWIRVRDFEDGFYEGTWIVAARFVRSETLRNVGGFDETLLSDEDCDFHGRILQLGKARRISSCFYHDEGKFSIFRYLGKKAVYANTLDRYIEKWGKDDPVVRKQLAPSERLFWIFVENGKCRRLTKKPVLAFGLLILRFGVGITYLTSRIRRASR